MVGSHCFMNLFYQHIIQLTINNINDTISTLMLTVFILFFYFYFLPFDRIKISA